MVEIVRGDDSRRSSQGRDVDVAVSKNASVARPDVDSIERHIADDEQLTEYDREILKNVWERGKASQEKALRDNSDAKNNDPAAIAEKLRHLMLEASVRLRDVINDRIKDIRVNDIAEGKTKIADLDKTKVADVREAILEHPDGGTTVHYFMQLENYANAKNKQLSPENRKSIEDIAAGKSADTKTSTLLGQIYIPSPAKQQ